MNTVRIEIMIGEVRHDIEGEPTFHVEAQQRVEYTQAEGIEQIGGGRLLKNLLGLVCRGCKRIDQILERKSAEIKECEACGKTIGGEPHIEGKMNFHKECWRICEDWLPFEGLT